MKQIFFVVLFLFGGGASADGLTLAAAVEAAGKNNPDIKRLEAAAEKTSWTKLEALSGHLPHLAVSYDHYFASKYMRENVNFSGALIGFPAAYPQDNFTLDATWTLFDGFQSLYSYRAATLNTEAAALELSRAKFQIEERVGNLFYQALAAQKLLEVAHANIKTLQDHLERANVSERAGYGTKFDILRIQATLEEARSEAEAAENEVQIKRDALADAMGEEKSENLTALKGELPVLKDGMVNKNIQLAMQDREDFRARALRDEAAHKLSQAAKSVWYPQIALFAQEDYYKFGSFDPAIGANGDYQNAAAFGVRLKWNLFDGGYSYAKQQQATAAAIEADAETRKAQIDLPKEFDTWKRKFFYNISLYKARLRVLEQFQESVRLAQVGVKAGVRTHTEMLDAELDLFRARAGVVRAQADAMEALGKLELALGHRLR